jgi:hypothetical protein
MSSFKVLLLLFPAVIFSFRQGQTYVITPGVGTEKLLVEKTKISKAFQILGKNDKFSEGIADGADFAIHTYRYIYTKRGITICSEVYEPKGEDLANAVISSIEFEEPASATLKNGVELGTGTYGMIIAKFGQPNSKEEYSNSTLLHFHKKGISFTIDKPSGRIAKIQVYKADL